MILVSMPLPLPVPVPVPLPLPVHTGRPPGGRGLAADADC
jgi:hypothetical protein